MREYTRREKITALEKQLAAVSFLMAELNDMDRMPEAWPHAKENEESLDTASGALFRAQQGIMAAIKELRGVR